MPKFLLYQCLFSLLLITFNLSLSAQGQNNSLSVTVYAENQSIEKRQEAFLAALDIAINRIANIQVQEDPLFEELRSTPARYVTGFRYSTRGEADIEALPIEDAPKLLLKVDFNSRLLLSEINRVAQFEVVSNRQQSVLFWVVETFAGRRQIITSQELSRTANALQQYGKTRRITAVLPEYNEAEQQLIRFADIVGGFDTNILLAAQSYQVDQNVTINLQQLQNREWRGVWTLLGDDEQRTRWLSTGASRAEVINAGMQQLQTRLNQIARDADIILAGDVTVEVQNVLSLADFANVEKIIGDLSSTASLFVNQINADKVRFTISIQGDPRNFQRQLARSSSFQTVLNQTTSNPTELADLTFFYLPVNTNSETQDSSILPESNIQVE